MISERRGCELQRGDENDVWNHTTCGMQSGQKAGSRKLVAVGSSSVFTSDVLVERWNFNV